MKKRNQYSCALTALLLCAALLSGCAQQSAPSAAQGGAQTQSEETAYIAAETIDYTAVTASTVSFGEEDTDTAWPAENAASVVFSESGAVTEGQGVRADGSDITITAAGTYVLSGTSGAGSVTVDAPGKTVRLVLNGLTLKSADSSALYVKDAEKTVIMLADGTRNTISDAQEYVFAGGEEDEPDAAIFSHDDLTINGSGTLIVNGLYQKGIKCKDTLRIMSGTITVTAVDDGIIGRDAAAVFGGAISVDAGGDGIKATNDQDAAKGFVLLSDATVTISAANDGIQAESALYVTDGEYKITTGGGSAMAPGQSRAQPAQADTVSVSAKALKAGVHIGITGGTFQLDACDDAVHSNQTIEIAAGTFSIRTGDDGVHADETLVISGGSLEISESYEGVEAANISILDGTLRITASDDGMNAAGGSDEEATAGPFGRDAFGEATNCRINIDGGTLVVDAGGDGIDANGSVYMTGGTVLVNGPENGANGALDYGGGFYVSGGVLFAAGSAGMAQAVSDSSEQNAVMMIWNSVQNAGTPVTLTGEGVTLTFAPKKRYQTLVVSAPGIRSGTAYTLQSGGTALSLDENGFSDTAAQEAASLVVTFTPSANVTWLDENGVTESRGAFGQGGGMPGGGPGRGGGADMPDGGQKPGRGGENGAAPSGDGGPPQRPDGESAPLPA